MTIPGATPHVVGRSVELDALSQNNVEYRHSAVGRQPGMATPCWSPSYLQNLRHCITVVRVFDEVLIDSMTSMKPWRTPRYVGGSVSFPPTRGHEMGQVRSGSAGRRQIITSILRVALENVVLKIKREGKCI